MDTLDSDVDPAVARSAASRRRLTHWLLVATVVAMFPLIFLGGMTTTKNAGMSVPDWPNTWGYNMFTFPVSRWVGGIFWEHTHRLMGTIVGLFAITSVVSAWVTRQRRVLRWGSVVLLLAVIVQGIIGGLRVTLVNLDLAKVHGCLAQATLCFAGLLALASSGWWQGIPETGLATALRPDVWRRVRLAGMVAVTCIYMQLIAGAIMRHEKAGLAIPDWPLSYGHVLPPMTAAAVAEANAERVSLFAVSSLPPQEPVQVSAEQIWMHTIHRTWAYVVTLACLWLMSTLWRAAGQVGSGLSRWLALAIGGLVAAQFSLGVLTVLWRKPADVATLHVATGALTLLSVFLVTAGAWQLCRAGVRAKAVPAPSGKTPTATSGNLPPQALAAGAYAS